MVDLLMSIPNGLRAAGTEFGNWEPIARVDEVSLGGLRRVTRGDLDLLLAYTDSGICLTDDRCPHMAAPLSLGFLDGCIVGCPLHRGRFDLATGNTVEFPTTGGLDADGGYHRPWAPPGSPEKPEPTDLKAQARAATRIRRMRYYPLRIREGIIEAQLPG